LAFDEETPARWERGTRRPRGKYLTLVEGFFGVVAGALGSIRRDKGLDWRKTSVSGPDEY
jgi:hypothetical protein